MTNQNPRDEILERLEPAITVAARRLLAAKSENRFILLRYHHDADGISAALAISRIAPMHAIQQNAAVYRMEDVDLDLVILHHHSNPLVVFVDFGSGEESSEGLRALKTAGAEILLLDHHPVHSVITEVTDHIVNPWMVETDEKASYYPAGYLACRVATAAGITNVEELASISCAGDHSPLLPVGEEQRQKAGVLDYMAMGGGHPMSFYEKVLEDGELWRSVYRELKEKLEAIAEGAEKIMRKKITGQINIGIIPMAALTRKYQFSGKGKIATYLISRCDPAQPWVVVGYDDRMLVCRANAATGKFGVNLSSTVKTVKQQLAGIVETGGGHPTAAALRVKKGCMKPVMDVFLDSVI